MIDGDFGVKLMEKIAINCHIETLQYEIDRLQMIIETAETDTGNGTNKMILRYLENRLHTCKQAKEEMTV